MRIDNKKLLQHAGRLLLASSEELPNVESQLSDNDIGLLNIIRNMRSTYCNLLEQIMMVHLQYKFRMPITDKMANLDEIISICTIFDVNVEIVTSEMEYGNHEFVFSSKYKKLILNNIINDGATYSIFGNTINGDYSTILMREYYTNNHRYPEIYKISNPKINQLVSLMFNKWMEQFPDSFNIVIGKSARDCFDKLNNCLAKVSYLNSNDVISFKPGFYSELTKYQDFMDAFNVIIRITEIIDHDDIIPSLMRHIDSVGYKYFANGSMIDILTYHIEFMIKNEEQVKIVY